MRFFHVRQIWTFAHTKKTMQKFRAMRRTLSSMYKDNKVTNLHFKFAHNRDTVKLLKLLEVTDISFLSCILSVSDVIKGKSFLCVSPWQTTKYREQTKLYLFRKLIVVHSLPLPSICTVTSNSLTIAKTKTAQQTSIYEFYDRRTWCTWNLQQYHFISQGTRRAKMVRGGALTDPFAPSLWASWKTIAKPSLM